MALTIHLQLHHKNVMYDLKGGWCSAQTRNILWKHKPSPAKAYVKLTGKSSLLVQTGAGGDFSNFLLWGLDYYIRWSCQFRYLFFFHQLPLSMEHQNRVSINALLLSEVWLGFELGLMRETPLRNRWNHCDRESDPCSNSSEPSALPLSYPQ